MGGGESGPAILPGKSAESLLIRLVAGRDEGRIMPAKGPRLTAEQIGVLRAWIDQGANWPDGADKSAVAGGSDHWAYKPLTRPAVPQSADESARRYVRNPIDAFVLAKLADKGLTPAPEADRRTLIRRACFDVTGLPPAPQEVECVRRRPGPAGLREAGGPAAWPARATASAGPGTGWTPSTTATPTATTRTSPAPTPGRTATTSSAAFNEDKPYARFVRGATGRRQALPRHPDGIVALGFIAAGPFDFVGQVELRDDTIDKAITRNLDRDDMVASTMNTFVSMTAQCARCHDHKFDPITQEDYYSLQAVFAGVDRADRPYDADPEVSAERGRLPPAAGRVGFPHGRLEKQAARGGRPGTGRPGRPPRRAGPVRGGRRPPGVRLPQRASSQQQTTVKWVQVDLGRPTPVQSRDPRRRLRHLRRHRGRVRLPRALQDGSRQRPGV